MDRRVRIASALAACGILSSCATPSPATKAEEPPGLSVRLPIAGATTLNIESDPFLAHPDLPLSVVDESRGRWLRLFEVNYSPAKPSAPPLPAGEEEPLR
jgi:hypothetical protein